jgi:hypothetical protein
MEQGKRPPAYRRLVIGTAIAMGTAVGLGVGSFMVLTGTWWTLIVLIGPVGIRVFGRLSGHLTAGDQVAWLWPLLALAVAVTQVVILPRNLALIGLAFAVALWFSTLVVAGILDVAVDPEGRLG